MSEEFRSHLVAFARTALKRAERATSEEATKQYLILPFLQLLGYDPLDPDEVVPEAQASFSDKFRNKVDYAVCQNNQSVMAIECKKVGSLTDANRGELKGYFNAVPTTKLGILTDGLIYEFFTDAGLENMMDDRPFVTIRLSEVAEERIDPTSFDALSRIRKDVFDPSSVGADARRKMFLEGYLDSLARITAGPSEDLVKLLMGVSGVEGKRTDRLLSEHTPLVREAIQIYFDRKILERVGFANRQDLVRTPAAVTADVSPVEATEPHSSDTVGTSIVTTETEMFIFDYVKYVKKRLAFLAKDESTFEKVHHVQCMDRKTLFTVFYRQERKGRLFDFREGRGDAAYRFDFPGQAEPLMTNDLRAMDEWLMPLFEQRVAELG